MAVYARQIKNAKRMIAKKGQFCTWSITDSNPPEPGKPWRKEPGREEIHNKIKMVFFPIDLTGTQTLARALDSEIVFGNCLALMAAVDFTPNVNYTVTKADGSKVKILNIKEIKPNGESILFTLECIE